MVLENEELEKLNNIGININQKGRYQTIYQITAKTDSYRIRFCHRLLSLLQPDSPNLTAGLAAGLAAGPPASALLTLLRMMLPSWLCSLVVMSNMAPPSPGTMVYSTSAFLPMSRSWALILPTTDPSVDDSGTRRWKKPVEERTRRHGDVHRGGPAANPFDSDAFHVACGCTSRHGAAAYASSYMTVEPCSAKCFSYNLFGHQGRR